MVTWREERIRGVRRQDMGDACRGGVRRRKLGDRTWSSETGKRSSETADLKRSSERRISK